MNFNNKKNQKLISKIIVALVIIGMLVPMIAGAILF